MASIVKVSNTYLCFRMMISLVFDGHIRNTVNIDYSFYVSYSIMVSLEFPADLLSLWGLNNIGRRWSASLSLAASSVAMMICGFSIGEHSFITSGF